MFQRKLKMGEGKSYTFQQKIGYSPSGRKHPIKGHCLGLQMKRLNNCQKTKRKKLSQWSKEQTSQSKFKKWRLKPRVSSYGTSISILGKQDKCRFQTTTEAKDYDNEFCMLECVRSFNKVWGNNKTNNFRWIW